MYLPSPCIRYVADSAGTEASGPRRCEGQGSGQGRGKSHYQPEHGEGEGNAKQVLDSARLRAWCVSVYEWTSTLYHHVT